MKRFSWIILYPGIITEERHGDRQELCSQISSLISAYIELAAVKAPDKDIMAFPGNLRRAVKNLSRVPIVSRQIPVDPGGRYDDLPYFTHFGDAVRFVGGINKPKLVECFDRCWPHAPPLHPPLIKFLILNFLMTME